jgi:hypothetical protein
VALKATVRNGRFVIDERTELPEGTVLDLVIDDEGDDLSPEEIAALNAAISRSLDQAASGQTAPASEILRRLRERHQSQ